MFTHFRGGIVRNVTYPNGATKTRELNAHAQVRPSTLTTPTGNTWSINRLYYTPTIGGTTYTTNVMGSLIYENIGRTLSYTYDTSGNISAITDTTGTISTEKTYQYDELNQLIRENDPVANKTTTYTYDVGGNILAKIEYPYTTGSLGTPTNTFVYTYGNTEWKDLLTEYNGNAITYDQIGNPLTYYNGTTFTWIYGRKLTNAVLANGTTISYKYNDSDIRTQKTVNGITTDYFLDGTNIVAQKTGNNTMWFYYDGDGTREAIEYNGNVYYYFYNAQGDVIGLFDNNLNVVVEYSYDSWGNVISVTGSLASTLGQDNPFRYRGYYYDSDTGLYYLNSRYYDSNTGRFINADGLISTGQGVLSQNMFAYCENNPICRADYIGNSWEGVKNFIKNLFGCSSSVVSTYSESLDFSTPAISPIYIKFGDRISKTISSSGNSSKFITAYTVYNTTHPIKSSSAGLNIKIGKVNLKINLSLDNLSISGSYTNGNTTNGIGFKINAADFAIGFNKTTEIRSWDNNTAETFFTDFGINGFTIMALYYFATTGQTLPEPQLQPAF